MLGKLTSWRRERAARRLAISDFQWQAAEGALPCLAGLGADERDRLRELARQFIADKQWSGAQGLELTAEIQLSVALQACLPVLNLGLDWYAGWVGIVVYPGDFVIPRQVMDEDGVMHEYDDEVLGEAWDGGPVLLSWFPAGMQPQVHTAAGAAPVNIVIHEFAHKLDMQNGVADGMPPLHPGMQRHQWREIFDTAFDDFNRRLDDGEDSALDPYAADDPAEFFAVMSEAFFTQPAAVRDEYPAVYQALAAFYRQDPAARAATAPGK